MSRATPNSARQRAIGDRLDKLWREKRERNRHVDVALAAIFPAGDCIGIEDAGLEFGHPAPAASDGPQ
jgi:hypothetical protein